ARTPAQIEDREDQHAHEVQMRYLKTGVLAAGAMASLGLAFAAPGRIARGQAAPDFAGTSLDGRKITLSEFRGKNPVVLNFYADFCAPCRKEFPHLKELDETLGGKGLRIVSVSMDEARDTASGIPNQYHVRFPVLFDPKGTIAQKY